MKSSEIVKKEKDGKKQMNKDLKQLLYGVLMVILILKEYNTQKHNGQNLTRVRYAE